MNDNSIKLSNSADPLQQVLKEIGSLARQKYPERKSWRRLKEAMLEASAFLRKKTNQLRAPIEIHEIARYRRIIGVEYSSLYDSNASLIPLKGGFTIILPNNCPKVRYRSCVAHEIGHTFFYDLNKNPPKRLIIIGSPADIFYKEEDICQAFARDLLMPSELIIEELSNENNFLSIDILSRISNRFIVSTELATVRLLRDFSLFDNSIVMFKEVDKLKGENKYNPTRKYFGKQIRKRFKKDIQQLISLISKTVDAGPPFDFFANISIEVQKYCKIQWKINNYKNLIKVTVLLNLTQY